MHAMIRKMRQWNRSLWLGFALVLCAPVNAEEIFVVVNANTSVDKLNRSQVINIFMGRSHFLGEESNVIPLDIRSDKQTKALFYEQLIKRSLSEVQSYWARLMFSGDATPPKQITSYTEIRKMLRDYKGAIAYLPASEFQPDLHDDLKVVYVLKEP